MLDRRTAPPLGKAGPFYLAKPQEILFANGLRLYIVEGGDQEVVRTEFLFPAGRWYEPQTGVSYFTTHLLNKGLPDMTSFEIASAFDQYGAYLEFSAGYDFSSVTLFSLAGKSAPVLDHLFRVLRESTLPEEELTLARELYLENLKVNEERVSYVASRLLRRKLFGKDHPYGREIEKADALAARRDRLVDFHRTHFVHPTVFLSGKVSPGLIAHLGAHLAQWPVSVQPSGALVDAHSDPTPVYVEKAGSVQSNIRLGKLVMGKASPGFIPLLFLNHVFGGYFGSRLMKNIREEKGLSYGIHSGLHPLLHGSMYTLSADVQKEGRALALQEIGHEMRRLRDERIPTDELETARSHFLGSLQMEVDTPFSHAEKRKGLIMMGLPEDYYDRMIAQVSEMTADTLQDTANEHLDPNTFIEVSVG